MLRDENVPAFDGIPAFPSGFFTSSNLQVIPLWLIIFVKGYSHYRVTYVYMIDLLNFSFGVILFIKAIKYP